jgi:hypothetical protein
MIYITKILLFLVFSGQIDGMQLPNDPEIDIPEMPDIPGN